MITLASDFGTPYPAAMRGVICSRSDARIVDIAHDFPRQDVRSAAFWLCEVLPWFPPAVHCAVIDPGVGTDRDAIVVRVGEHAIVAPDNGLALPTARRLQDWAEDSPQIESFVIEYENPASSTFHGRDVFAPTAAAVHNHGVGSLETIDRLTSTEEVVDCTLPEPDLADDRMVGEVLVIDGFGNVITNIPGDVLDSLDSVRVNGEVVPVGRSFAAVATGDRLVTVGSHGNVELAVNQGRGDDAFGLAVGDRVELTDG